MIDEARIGQEDDTDEIFEGATYEADRPEAFKKFLPWHRPRKHFVREKQWCRQIASLLEEHPLNARPLKYLGLPGVDLLDLRHFHGTLCEPRQLQLRFLGFNRSAKPATQDNVELNVSLDEVRRLSYVDPLSEVIGDDLALIANENSLACKRMREMGPYDVINLDLCDGIAASSAGPYSYFDILNALLPLQSRSPRPWLLFITTRTDRSNIDQEVLKKLVSKYISNLENCAAFRDESAERFAIGDTEAVMDATSNPERLLQVFLTAFFKWVFVQAAQQQPYSTVEMRSVIGYRVQHTAACEDMVSIALRVNPSLDPVQDKLHLAANRPRTPDECLAATRALRRVSKRLDVDQILESDKTLRDEMIQAMAKLMRAARYDEETYVHWAQTN